MITEIRLNKYIASTGLCSRRQADILIAKGLVSVNGHIVNNLGAKIKDTDKVAYKNKILRTNAHVYILLNKPKDYICTIKDEKDRKIVTQLITLKNSIYTIADTKSKRFSKGNFLFLNELMKKESGIKARIFPVGRLDRNTTGILILTNDGNFTHKLTHPSQKITKQYDIILDKPLKYEDFEKIKQGIILEDGKVTVDSICTAEASLCATKDMGYGRVLKTLGFIDENSFKIDKKLCHNKGGNSPYSGSINILIKLHSGKNRIIRRIFESLGYNVIKLDRILFGDINKKKLPKGKWRFLTPQEMSLPAR